MTYEEAKCNHKNCPFQIGSITSDCDIKECPYRTTSNSKEFLQKATGTSDDIVQWMVLGLILARKKNKTIEDMLAITIKKADISAEVQPLLIGMSFCGNDIFANPKARDDAKKLIDMASDCVAHSLEAGYEAAFRYNLVTAGGYNLIAYQPKGTVPYGDYVTLTAPADNKMSYKAMESKIQDAVVELSKQCHELLTRLFKDNDYDSARPVYAELNLTRVCEDPHAYATLGYKVFV